LGTGVISAAKEAGAKQADPIEKQSNSATAITEHRTFFIAKSSFSFFV
jgi:hypothetical protein